MLLIDRGAEGQAVRAQPPGCSLPIGDEAEAA